MSYTYSIGTHLRLFTANFLITKYVSLLSYKGLKYELKNNLYILSPVKLCIGLFFFARNLEHEYDLTSLIN